MERGHKGAALIVCGPPGCGKSTVAEAVVKALGGIRIASDHTRYTVLGKAKYSAADTSDVYRSMGAQAAEIVAGGGLAVLDGVFSPEAHWHEACGAAGIPAIPCIWVVVDKTERAQRIAKRTVDGASESKYTNTSGADLAPPKLHIAIDGSGKPATVAARAIAAAKLLLEVHYG